ncbi:gas vesicle protein GvpF [Leptolyngbya iicbica]|uniref:GvpL/GvpF family gas vesicle protein n=2 Tax=Cyanophyceae TaxID=3028117 RepID=A0A4Q7E587_9CYAN|nr:GvpL/GvpF family gas vesicle protein [Leptolyngbya sp. LK]RZM75268.1 GvpL/GvpF family gas vesicle protein [Leptolyngbya sp. LK]
MPQLLYLYGIFPAPGPQDLEVQGLDQQPIHTHIIDEFVFLYSVAQQERYLASRKNLLGHERVLEAAMKVGYRTLLPLQFGLIIETWDRVIKELITPRGDALKRLFAKLEGRREVSVKLLWGPDAELNQLMEEDAGLRAERDRLEGQQLSMDQIVDIGQAIETAMTERKDDVINAFRQRLNALAIEVLENDPLTDAMIYNTAYLIPWEDEVKFSQAIEELDEQFEDRLRIRYNNFTAPYNFAQLDQLS